MKKKIFMWYATSSYGENPTQAPHYVRDAELIGKKFYHTLDELLKMNISDSLKKRLTGAKVGSKIKIHYLHSNGDLMVKRIDEKNLSKLKQMETYFSAMWSLQEQLHQLEEANKVVIATLLKIK